jgi:hypothetical protein
MQGEKDVSFQPAGNSTELVSALTTEGCEKTKVRKSSARADQQKERRGVLKYRLGFWSGSAEKLRQNLGKELDIFEGFFALSVG